MAFRRSICRSLALRVHLQDRHLDRFVQDVVVDADDHALFRVDLALVAEGSVGDLALEIAVLDRRYDSAHVVDPAEVGVGVALGLVRQRLDEIAPAQRVNRVGRAGFVRDHLLRAQRQPRGLLARQGERLVHRIRVQATACRPSRPPAPGSQCG